MGKIWGSSYKMMLFPSSPVSFNLESANESEITRIKLHITPRGLYHSPKHVFSLRVLEALSLLVQRNSMYWPGALQDN
jgi:hypothetical protein